MEIKKTKNYAQFSRPIGQRMVVPGHLARLQSAIEKKNLLRLFPILCTDDGTVFDGYHRLMAAKALRTDIYYLTIPKGFMDAADIHIINSVRQSWKFEDFLNFFATRGNRHYKELRTASELIEKLSEGKVRPRAAARVIGASDSGTCGFTLGTFKDGGYIFDEGMAKTAYQVVKYAREIGKADFRFWYSRAFLVTLMRLWGNEDFDSGKLLHSQQKKPFLTYGASVTDYANQISNAMNRGRKYNLVVLRPKKAAV